VTEFGSRADPRASTVRWPPGSRQALRLLLGVGRLASALDRATRALAGPCLTEVHTEPASGRSYRVLTRADHDRRRPAPLLFLLHAYATHPDVALRGFALEALAVHGRGFILVVPEGRRDAAGNYCWNASRACCGEGPARPDDLGYLRGVLAAVRQRYALDPPLASVLGVSNGGFMAYRWACAAPAELAAIVSISGAGPGSEDPPCALATPVSLLHIHGDRDQLVEYAGGRMRDSDYPSAAGSLAPFVRAARAAPTPRSRRMHTLLYGSILEQRWTGRDARVALWTVRGRGHQLRAAQACVLEILDFLAGC
jgi:polyhydroxybutyrate depolymerase